jgi:hypothetical protein
MAADLASFALRATPRPRPALVEEHGGTITFPRSVIPGVGALVRFLDTEGNHIGVLAYDTPPHT